VSLEERDGLRADVEAHLTRRDAVDGNRLGLGAFFHGFGYDNVHGQDEPVAGLLHEALRLLQVIFLHEGVPGLISQRLEEREAHGAPYEQRARGS
jgi:hypothetical protein